MRGIAIGIFAVFFSTCGTTGAQAEESSDCTLPVCEPFAVINGAEVYRFNNGPEVCYVIGTGAAISCFFKP